MATLVRWIQGRGHEVKIDDQKCQRPDQPIVGIEIGVFRNPGANHADHAQNQTRASCPKALRVGTHGIRISTFELEKSDHQQPKEGIYPIQPGALEEVRQFGEYHDE